MNRVRQDSTPIVIILLLAAGLVCRVWTAASTVGFDYTPGSDDRRFEGIGRTLAQTGHYAIDADSPPTANASPLLPWLLAGIYRLFGHRRAVVQSILILISALTAPMTLFLGREIGGKRVGTLAGLFVALDPFAWLFAGLFYSEALFTFLFTLALLFLIRAVSDQRRRCLILLGIALALCALARPNGLMIALGSVGLLAAVDRGRVMDKLRRATEVLVVVALLMAPWVVRNALVFGRFIPTTSQTGHVLLGIYNETCLRYRCLDWVNPRVLPELSVYHLSDLDEMARADRELEIALSYWQTYPVEFLALVPGKLALFWAQDTFVPATTYRSYPPPILLGFQRLYYWPLFLVGVLGLFALYIAGHRQAFVILTSFVAFFSLAVLLFWGNARLRVPLHPLLAVAGAFALTKLSKKTPRRSEELDPMPEHHRASS